MLLSCWGVVELLGCCVVLLSCWDVELLGCCVVELCESN